MKNNLFKIRTLALALTTAVISFPSQAANPGSRDKKPTPEEVLNNLDKDKNGVISMDEARSAEKGRLYRRFGSIDSNKDGEITLSELKVKQHKPHPSSDWMEKYDSNGDGTMSFEEARLTPEDKLYKLFGAMDANRDGNVEATELESFQARAHREKRHHRKRGN